MSVFNFATERSRDAAKKLDWRSLLAHHPAFSCLSPAEMDDLLREDASKERTCARGEEIVRQGDAGDSCFLIGAGSVQIRLDVPGGTPVVLSTLRKGDVFGEMAVMDGTPRAATVSGVQDSVLLEIEGRAFRELIAGHPDLELAIRVKLTERLRAANEQLLALKLKGGDEALRLFDAKLSAEVRVFDASLRAAQAVFEQTKMRADEVITSAERARTRLTTITSSVGAVVAAALAVLGFLGFKGMWDLNELQKRIAASAQTVETFQATSDQLLKKMSALEETTRKARETLFREQLREFSNALARGAAPIDAQDHFEVLTQLDELKDEQVWRLLNEVEGAILDPAPPGGGPTADPARPDYTVLLGMMLKHAETPRTVVKAYSLLLADAILLEKEHLQGEPFGGTGASRDALEDRLASFVRDHKGQLLARAEDLADLEAFLRKQGTEKLRAFERIGALIPKA